MEDGGSSDIPQINNTLLEIAKGLLKSGGVNKDGYLALTGRICSIGQPGNTSNIGDLAREMYANGYMTAYQYNLLFPTVAPDEGTL